MLARTMVQISRRLVRQEKLRGTHQRPGNRDPLLLAARNLADFVIQAMTETDPFQNLAGGSFGLQAIVAPDEPRHHRILKRREFGQKMVELKDESDVTIPESGQLGSRPFEDILAVEQHLTSRGRIQGTEKMEQCALSRTRRTYDRDEVSASNFEIDVFEDDHMRRRRFVDLREVSGFNHAASENLPSRMRRL
jgi:hypothetical protein